jgi:two-component system, LytTR family, sensor kinase
MTGNWTLRRLLRHIAYWLFWLLLYATVNSSKGDFGFGFWIRFELFVMLVKVPFTYLMMYVLVPVFLIRKRYVRFFTTAMLAVFSGGVIIWWIHTFLAEPYFGYYAHYNFCSSGFFYKTLDLLYICTFPVIYKLHQFYLLQETKHREMEAQKLKAELELLKNQLHPHFLFNTLNNLYGMILSGQAKAADVVVLLSNMLGYMLYESNGTTISLQKEVEQLKNYIALESIRYDDRLDLSFECTGVEASHEIAPLLLIGFIENAFKHGVSTHTRQAWIRINLVVKDKNLDFLIENSVETGQRSSKEIVAEGGIGLKNIRQRLQLIYPDRHQLKIEYGDTYCTHLKLQL